LTTGCSVLTWLRTKAAKSVVTWARYAEAFAFDEGTELLTLDNPT
jgi:hypothetical protein